MYIILYMHLAYFSIRHYYALQSGKKSYLLDLLDYLLDKYCKIKKTTQLTIILMVNEL